jgi:hypothetical protein
MSSFYRYTNLTTKGNLGLVPAGQDVISPVDGQMYTPFENGRPILYDPKTNKTIGVGGIATAKKIRFGVGYNPNGGLLATEIRHLGSPDIDLCRTSLKVNVQAPQCPVPQIIDFEFDCTFTGKDYMVQFDIDDFMTRSYFAEGQFGPLLYNLRTDVTGCDTCSEEENCEKLACQLAAKVNGDWIKNYPGTSKLGLNSARPNHGIKVVMKYTNNISFTLAESAVENTCGTGCAVKGLKSIDATGIDPLVLQNVVDPSAPEQTLVEQLQSVVDQIDVWLTGKGSAALKQIDCCSYSIEINSCLTGFVLTYHDDATTSGTSTPAFVAFTPSEPCVGCEGDTEVTYTCGVRVYVYPLDLPCNCKYPDGNPPSYYGRTVKITAWGDGWDNTSYRVVPVQSQKVPLGTGYQVQQQEKKQSVGGQGFDYSPGMSYSNGNLPLPLNSSAAVQAINAVCEDLYCIWSVVTEEHTPGQAHARLVHNSQTLNFINVPREDLNDVEDVQAVMEALDARGFCSEIDYECVDLES